MEQKPWRDRIVWDRDLHHGEPCIKGTRVTVSILVASMADLGINELLREYPQLTHEDVQAALLFAAEAAHGTLVA
jgi:uncharacterized protein (DUF433 family)